MNPKNPELVKEMAKNLCGLSKEFIVQSYRHRYTYNFTWLGRPIIQYPQDIMAVQQLIYKTKPGLIIEAGTAHGGLTVFCASVAKDIVPGVKVVSVDVDLREHNKKALDESISLHNLDITFIKGSSVDEGVIMEIDWLYLKKGKPNVLILLDSCHTKDHVLRELGLYSKFCSPGNYIVVFDTLVEYLDKKDIPDRPWGPGDSPHTAVQDFLAKNSNFVIDHELENELLITSCPGGFLRMI